MAQFHPRLHNPLAIASQAAQSPQPSQHTHHHPPPHHHHSHVHPHVHSHPHQLGMSQPTAVQSHHHHYAPATQGRERRRGGGGGGGGEGDARWQSKMAKQIELESLPSADQASYYANNHPEIDLPPLISLPQGNRNHKLDRGSRFLRKGKMYGWSPSWEEAVTQKRVKKRLTNALKLAMPASAADLGMTFDIRELGGGDSVSSSPSNAEFGDDVALTAEDMAITLALPVPTTYLDLALSPAMKYTLGQALKEKALMRTVGDLIEGETGLLNVLGELRYETQKTIKMEVDEKEVARVGKLVEKYEEEEADEDEDEEMEDVADVKDENLSHSEANRVGTVEMANGHATPPIPMEEDVKPAPTHPATASSTPNGSTSAPPPKAATDSTILLHGEPFYVPPGSMVTYETRDSIKSPMDEEVRDVYPEVELTALQKLFVTTDGLITTINPPPNDPRAHLPPNHPQHVGAQKVRLTPETQKLSVIAAFEKIKELTSDCNEYVKRLEEIRERIANLGRARRKVWNVVRERAITSSGERLGEGEADAETIRKRLEQELGNGIATRNRRAAAGAG